MRYYVYVLRSVSSGRYYVGSTRDVQRRLQDHNRSKNKSVRGRGPFEIVFVEEYVSRLDAHRRELQIKRFKGGDAFRQLVSEAKGLCPRSLSPSSSG